LVGLQAAPSGGDAISDTTTPVIQSSDVMEPFDYLLHRFETDPRGRSGGIGLHILDQAPDFERVQEACDRASRSAIRMRQKVVVPPFGLGTPEWVVDPDFDLNFHVRRVRAPAPGTFAQVLDMTRQMLEDPLDIGRALWIVVIVEGLEDDRAAMLMKTSHAITDGMGSMILYDTLFDSERDPFAFKLMPYSGLKMSPLACAYAWPPPLARPLTPGVRTTKV